MTSHFQLTVGRAANVCMGQHLQSLTQDLPTEQEHSTRCGAGPRAPCFTERYKNQQYGAQHYVAAVHALTQATGQRWWGWCVLAHAHCIQVHRWWLRRMAVHIQTLLGHNQSGTQFRSTSQSLGLYMYDAIMLQQVLQQLATRWLGGGFGDDVPLAGCSMPHHHRPWHCCCCQCLGSLLLVRAAGSSPECIIHCIGCCNRLLLRLC